MPDRQVPGQQVPGRQVSGHKVSGHKASVHVTSWHASPAGPPSPAWAVLACLALLAISGCEVDQHVDVRLSGSGSAEIRVELHRLFVDYLLTLAEVSGDASLEPGTVFDLEQVEQAVSKRAGVHLEWIDSPAPERLELRLVFDDLAAVLGASTAAATAAGDVPLISLTGDSPRTLRVHIASDNYHQLTTLFPALENPLLIGLGPQPDLEVTDEEYLETIAFVLGEQGPQAVLDSNVSVAVRVDGRVIEQEGGELLDDGSVLITIPLLRILVLDQPLAYTIVFE